MAMVGISKPVGTNDAAAHRESPGGTSPPATATKLPTLSAADKKTNLAEAGRSDVVRALLREAGTFAGSGNKIQPEHFALAALKKRGDVVTSALRGALLGAAKAYFVQGIGVSERLADIMAAAVEVTGPGMTPEQLTKAFLDVFARSGSDSASVLSNYMSGQTVDETVGKSASLRANPTS